MILYGIEIYLKFVKTHSPDFEKNMSVQNKNFRKSCRLTFRNFNLFSKITFSSTNLPWNVTSFMDIPWFEVHIIAEIPPIVQSLE